VKYDEYGNCIEYVPVDVLYGEHVGATPQSVVMENPDINAPVAYITGAMMQNPDINAPAAYITGLVNDAIGLTGADYVGYTNADYVELFDLGSETRKMNALKPVTVEIARLLVKYGTLVIGEAISTAEQPWYKPDLPGKTSRADVLGHLQWHANNLVKFVDPLAVYPSGDDLKAWTLRAYIESNAASEGNERTAAAWNAMWSEIREALAKIPREVLKAAGGAAGAVASGVTGIPVWGLGLIGAATIGLLGFAAYKLAMSSAGQHAIGYGLGRRLGGR
jgi:hypothetical protein